MTVLALEVVAGQAVGFLPAPVPEAPLFCLPAPGVTRGDLDLLVARLAARGLQAAVHTHHAQAAVVIEPPAEVAVVEACLREAVAHCQPSEVSALLARVQGFVPSKPRRPILDHVLVRAGAGRLVVTAGDHEATVSATCAALTQGSLATAVPARYLAEWLAVPNGWTRLTLRHQLAPQEQLLLAGQRGRCVSELALNAWPAEEYPAPADDEPGECLSLAARALKEAVKACAKTVAKGGARQGLELIWLARSAGVLTLTSADSHSLTEVSLAVDGAGPALSLGLPAAALRRVVGLAGAGGIEAKLSPQGLVLALGEGSVATVRADTSAEQPTFARLLERIDPGVGVTVDRAELLAGIKQVLAGSGRAARLTLTLDSALSVAVGACRRSIAVDRRCGQPTLSCEFEGSRLREALAGLPTGELWVSPWDGRGLVLRVGATTRLVCEQRS